MCPSSVVLAGAIRSVLSGACSASSCTGMYETCSSRSRSAGTKGLLERRAWSENGDGDATKSSLAVLNESAAELGWWLNNGGCGMASILGGVCSGVKEVDARVTALLLMGVERVRGCDFSSGGVGGNSIAGGCQIAGHIGSVVAKADHSDSHMAE